MPETSTELLAARGLSIIEERRIDLPSGKCKMVAELNPGVPTAERGDYYTLCLRPGEVLCRALFFAV